MATLVWTGLGMATHHFCFVGTQSLQFTPIRKTLSASFLKYGSLLYKINDFSYISLAGPYLVFGMAALVWTGLGMATHHFCFVGTPGTENNSYHF